MSKLTKFLIVFSCLFFSYYIYRSYREHTHGTWRAYQNAASTDCDMVLPPHLRVVYNEAKGRYAIELTNWNGKVYLWARSANWIDWHYSVHTDFSDSCTAKSFAKQYIREWQEHREGEDYK